MPVPGTPCTGTCDRPVGTLWVIKPCAYPVRVSVFSQGSCTAVLCLGVLPHACTLSKCAPLDYTQVCVALDFLCRCKRLHAVSPLWDCSGQYFPPVCLSFGCVCVFFTFILDIKFVGRTSRGHTGGRSQRISHPPSFCGACLNFSREKDSAIPFPRRL